MVHRTLLGLLLFAIVACLSATANGQESLERLLEPIINKHAGEVAVAIEHLPSGESYEINGDTPMPTASLIKFPVMVALYEAIQKGEADLATSIRTRGRRQGAGLGHLDIKLLRGNSIDAKRRAATDDGLFRQHGDESGRRTIIGLPATARLMEALGCPNTKLHAKVFRRDTSIFPEAQSRVRMGSTTANEMLKLLKLSTLVS